MSKSNNDCVLCDGKKGTYITCVDCNGAKMGCYPCGGRFDCSTGAKWAGSGVKWANCTACNGSGKKNPVLIQLEQKTKEMRDEHEEKLKKLFETITKNEKIIHDIVDKHQLAISELNNQNLELSLTNQQLLKNQQMMTAFMCAKLKMLEDKGLIEKDKSELLENSMKLLNTVPKLK